MKRNKPKKMILLIPPYGRKCLILVGFRDLQKRVMYYKMGKELSSMFKSHLLPTKLDDAQAYTDTRGRYILWLPTVTVTSESIKHEGRHISEWVQEYVGESGGHEYRAYFPAWFEEEVRKRLK